MFNASSISLIVIALATQFHTINAGFDWLGFFDSWIFGSNTKSTVFIYSKFVLEGEQAEKRFVDNEVHKVSQPKILAAQLKQNTIDANKWIEYHRSTNFIMRYIAGWAIDTLWERRTKLEEELKYAEENVDLEPFCHDRFHNHNPEETDLICSKAFQNQFFRNKGWMLDEHYGYGKDCPRVTVSSSVQKNERNEHRKLVFFREARRCRAYTQKGPEASPSYFGVYLISHEVYLKRKQFAYFVLLSRDHGDRDAEKDNNPENRRKSKLKKIFKYLSFWEETKMQIVAYIES